MGFFAGIAALCTPIALVVFWIFATRGRRNHPKWEVLRRFRYAHRGLHDPAQGVPENSMAAFRRARAFQCGIELDVHLTKDGRLAVIHDKSLLRTAGADVIVEQLTVPQLKSYRREGTQEKIPLLEEVLEVFQDGPPLLVELKADYFDVKKLVETAVRTLDQYRVNYCIESFHPGILLWLARHRPDICRGQLSENFWRCRGELKAWQAFAMTNLLSNFLTRPDFISFRQEHRWVPSVWLCRKLHRLKMFGWTVRSPREMEQLEREGFSVIFEGFQPPLHAPVWAQKTA